VMVFPDIASPSLGDHILLNLRRY